MPPPRRNKNASGKRVARSRIAVNLSLSTNNGLLDLFVEYLSRQGIPPTDERIRDIASESAYRLWAEWLKREIEQNEDDCIL